MDGVDLILTGKRGAAEGGSWWPYPVPSQDGAHWQVYRDAVISAMEAQGGAFYEDRRLVLP